MLRRLKKKQKRFGLITRAAQTFSQCRQVNFDAMKRHQRNACRKTTR